ncbi:hypothetical protein [Streptococcus sp.]|uniref:hypothetical protein n=1 Tax=Streptococcus sp. TaxID=1306 RepID=UPI0025ED7C0D|nr:hypothetical protein [Streptococcus sp.]
MIGLMGLFFYNKIGSIIPMVVLPTTEIIEPKLRESNGSLFIFKERKRLHKCNLNGILENVKTLS